MKQRVCLAIAIALNALVPSHNLYSVALVLALVAVVWYLIVGFSFRFRQKIAAPPANALLSPIQGRIAFSRGNEDVTLLNIRKVLLDRVEIRCPHDSSRLEDGILHLDSVAGKISFRFDFLPGDSGFLLHIGNPRLALHSHGFLNVRFCQDAETL